jgi:hypothetical protein
MQAKHFLERDGPRHEGWSISRRFGRAKSGGSGSGAHLASRRRTVDMALVGIRQRTVIMRVWRGIVGRPAAKTVVEGEVETSERNREVVRRSRIWAVRKTGRAVAGGQGRIR